MGLRKESILIIMVAGIGDLVLASPAIRAIRNGRPDADITLLTSSEALPIARNYPYVDLALPFPIREIINKKQPVTDALKIAFDLRRKHYDAAINLYLVDSRAGALRMGALFTAVGARERIGHDNYGFGIFLTKKVAAEVFRGRHITEAMLDVAAAAGGVPDGKGIEVFWNKTSEEKWSGLFSPAGGAGGGGDVPAIGINPGGNFPTKRWVPERFAALADRLVIEKNAKIYIFGGPGEEGIAALIAGKMKNDATVLTGKLDLNDLAYISSRLDLMITNDSGPMHIAAAAGAPLVVIFGTGAPELYGPYLPPDRFEIVRFNIECSPCEKKECDHLSCLKNIEPEQVFDAALRMLNRNK